MGKIEEPLPFLRVMLRHEMHHLWPKRSYGKIQDYRFLYHDLSDPVFVRWNPIHRTTFKHRLSSRQTPLPSIDVFVCTADRKMEPPMMVINTVLSVLAYDYPPEKLNVYLSDDDGGLSELMFYALLEASAFAKYWLPFCKKFKVNQTSPDAYFSTIQQSNELSNDMKHTHVIKKLYHEMQDRIETANRLGRVSNETRDQLQKGFDEWKFNTTSSDHQAIIQILIDGSFGSTSLDVEGQPIPTLVYVAREKRSEYNHNFKAGALNALIRVSATISNSPIILTVDCDVYSNNSESVRDAVCCFMDEDNGNDIAYVQFPQSSRNLTKYDLYASCFRLEMGGMDANGGPCYIGGGCFLRRNALELSTMRPLNQNGVPKTRETKEKACVGIMYGFPVEDMVTGLAIQCRGWKSVYLNTEQKGFVGVAPTTLLDVLVQHTRWSEGQFSTLLSKFCPFLYGIKRIPFRLQMSYTLYFLWAPNCLPVLAYVTIPQLCLLKEIPLFPKISSLWILPFLYVIISQYMYSLGEFVSCGGTVKGWWNEWLFKRTTSYFVAFLETLLRQFGFSELRFMVTPKVVDKDVLQRYKKEVMEFGSHSRMFVALGSIAMLNLFGLFSSFISFAEKRVFDELALQTGLCVVVAMIKLPVYDGLFVRTDEGKIPTSVSCTLIVLPMLACMLVLYY
ncbi:cellulose synthase-like protein E1 [Rutidosis leptorrhynchoides]|uniref:cellulose synthase-like protein E1 n=1 Tax=Rutidosis leptorrhynchoides TaxID=125765 RepID=UPI003A99AC10